MRSRWAERAHGACGSQLRSEKGGVTAEFAAALPAVVLVLGCCLGAVQIVGEHIRLTDAAADASRALSRGDDDQRVRALVGELVPGASLAVTRRGEFVCARVGSIAGAGSLGALGVPIDASSCALAGGL